MQRVRVKVFSSGASSNLESEINGWLGKESARNIGIVCVNHSSSVSGDSSRAVYTALIMYKEDFEPAKNGGASDEGMGKQ